jgi:NifB/MoaA-like Fe-S oxidoreductase
VDPFTRETAKAVMDIAYDFQNRLLKEIGTRFVFPSDEMVLISGEPLPTEAEYEGYPQLENGVGLLRKFEDGLKTAAAENTLPAVPRRVRIPCGSSIAPVMRQWVETYGPQGVQAAIQPIRNTFFGETITVTGLITGGDLIDQLKDADEDEILLCGNTLRAEGDLFLDNISLEQVRSALKPKVTVVPNTGADLFRALLGKSTEFRVQRSD